MQEPSQLTTFPFYDEWLNCPNSIKTHNVVNPGLSQKPLSSFQEDHIMPTQMQTPLSNYNNHVIPTLATLQEKPKDTIIAEEQSNNNSSASLNELISEEKNCNNTATSSTKLTNLDKIQAENSLLTDLKKLSNQKNYPNISGKLFDFSSYTKNQLTTLSDISGNPAVDLIGPQQLQTNPSSSQNTHSMIT